MEFVRQENLRRAFTLYTPLAMNRIPRARFSKLSQSIQGSGWKSKKWKRFTDSPSCPPVPEIHREESRLYFLGKDAW